MVSSDFRITQLAMANSATSNMQQTLARLQQLQGEISSNRRIQKPSDDPVGTVSALHLRSGLGQNTQIGRNISDAQSWLGNADNTLSSVVSQIQRVRDLAVQSQNGALGSTELAAMGDELDQLKASLIGLANTKLGNRSLFAGTAAGAAFDSTGNYLGTGGAIERTIAPGQRLQINLTGDSVFGAPGNNLFTVIGDLATAVRAGNTTGIDAALTNLDTRTATVQSQLAVVGARGQRIDNIKVLNDSGAITMKQSLSLVEDVDLPKAIMDMQMQQVAYQAAIAATAKAIQPSLLDFLK
jgi:flagellar hook-associated protein 3 FlgL